MAPTNKRSEPAQSTYYKENGRQALNAHNTKENSNKNSSSKLPKTTKELEILDFHESWLEEMELYKDQLYIHKHNNNMNQMLSPHNHAHNLDSPPLRENSKDNNNYSSFPVNLTSIVNAAAAIATELPTYPATKRKSSVVIERKSLAGAGNEKNTKTVKSRSPRNNTVPTNVVSPDLAPVTSNQTPPESNESKTGTGISPQVLLKRHREENPTPKVTASNHPKRSNHGTSHANLNSTATGNAPHLLHHNTVKSGIENSAANVIANKLAPKPNSKIIVNPFHASSLLSSHHVKETRNILTQNGLSRSAATAYETSLYASNYLTKGQRNSGNNQFIGNANRDYATYIGVSLAGDLSRDTLRPDDDPCAAIDDVHAYSDSSESDEEYEGQPFFLECDGIETKQSIFVRDTSELHTNTTSSEFTETETASTASQPSSQPLYYRPKCIITPSLFPNVPPYLNFSSHAERGPPMPSALHRILKWKLSPVMPKIVKRVVLNSGFRIIKNTTDWMAVWEKHMKSPGFRTIRSHQKYNHMPGSFRIGRKDTMWRSIHNNMRKHGSKEFGFMQRSYVMPDDLENLRQAWPKNASKLTKWIVKPPASARGTGIRIVNKWSQFPKDRPLVVQKYIERPLLINDNKFDMRIYVFITSINPLRIYMYKDGLARFASVKYSSELTTLDDRCMHLTNYSINKYSQNYTKNEDYNECQGHKWTLQSLWSCLEKRGVNTKRLWATLRNLVIKAIISGESGLNRMYRQNVNFRYNCYELFGFDVLLDENLIPWLLEINISPSLHSELPLDLHVKGPLIQAILNTALYQVPPKLTEQQQRDILDELSVNLDTSTLCLDKRIFTTCLTPEEVRKHNQFTNRIVEFREEYIDAILENLLPDDVRCLIIAEDEFARCKPLERIFPTTDTYQYLKFIENPRYYNRLLDAWEHKYGRCREEGIAVLRKLCKSGLHLQVSDATLEKEPNVSLTEIDMLHVRKSEDRVIHSQTQSVTPDNNIGDSIGTNAPTKVYGSPERNSRGTMSKQNILPRDASDGTKFDVKEKQ